MKKSLLLCLLLLQYCSIIVGMKRTLEFDADNDQKSSLVIPNIPYEIWVDGILKQLVSMTYSETVNSVNYTLEQLPVSYDLFDQRPFVFVVSQQKFFFEKNNASKRSPALNIRNVFKNLSKLTVTCKEFNDIINCAIPSIIIDLTYNHTLGNSQEIVDASKCSAAKNFAQQAKDLRMVCKQHDLLKIKGLLNPYTFAFRHPKHIRDDLLKCVMQSYGKTQENESMIQSVALILNFCRTQIEYSLLSECTHKQYNKIFALLFEHNNHILAYQRAELQPIVAEATYFKNINILNFLIKKGYEI